MAMSEAKKARTFISPLVAAAAPEGTKPKKDAKPKKERKRSRHEIQEDEEERRLTAMIFGGEYKETAVKDVKKEAPHVSESKVDLFQLDRTGDDEIDDYDAEEEQNAEQDEKDEDGDEEVEAESAAKPVWVDEDDVELSIDLMQTNRLKKLRNSKHEDVGNMDGTQLEKRLRKRFEHSTMATARTDWARLDAPKPDDEDEYDFLGSSSAPLLSSTGRLPAQILQVIRCKDANQKDFSKSTVQAVHFHPGSDPDRPLMLTAGLDKTLRFFQVGADESDKIHGIHFPKMPIYSAQFLGDTGKVVVSGRRSFFYMYDMVAGKLDLIPKIMGRDEKSLEKFTVSPDGQTIAFLGNDGYVILIDVKSRQWIADLKMNGSVRAVTFTPDGEQILASGSDGDVYRFDLRTKRCLERFSNDDGTVTSSLASSQKHLAVGAESGVVNLYSDRNSAPLKSIMNLSTNCDLAKFNHDGQILAFSTRREKHGLKLLHVPTQTVFSNWPTSKTPLQYVWSLDFSPQSKFMAIGNDKGKVLLYKLSHYHD